MCNKCLLKVTPSTLKFCAEGCKKRIKFSDQICEKHNQLKVYGTICTLCVDNVTVKSMDMEVAIQVDQPPEDEVLLIIRNGEITYDKYNFLNRAGERYHHLFQGGMVGGGECADDNDGEGVETPQNIIYKIAENGYDTVFHIQTPNISTYPGPYLQKYQAEISDGIKSSNLIHNDNNYKANITAVCKYYKNGGEEEGKNFGVLYYPSRFFVLPAYSEAIHTQFISEMADDLTNVMCDRDGKMQGSDWVYMGDFIPYPKNKRGLKSVINLNYHLKPRDIDVGETAECLLWLLNVIKDIGELRKNLESRLQMT